LIAVQVFQRRGRHMVKHVDSGQAYHQRTGVSTAGRLSMMIAHMSTAWPLPSNEGCRPHCSLYKCSGQAGLGVAEEVVRGDPWCGRPGQVRQFQPPPRHPADEHSTLGSTNVNENTRLPFKAHLHTPISMPTQLRGPYRCPRQTQRFRQPTRRPTSNTEASTASASNA
jgi:hypothetical protein